MKRLVQALASIVRDKVVATVQGRGVGNTESRFIFHGPPLELLDPVFVELSKDGGIRIDLPGGLAPASIPVLLQLPAGKLAGPNPDIGSSGRCDENRLLDIRNAPGKPSFLALVPPGQHNNKSVKSTSEEFGIAPDSNRGHASFDTWWKDAFIQDLLSEGLRLAGLSDADDARFVIEHAAEALDEMDRPSDGRDAIWRLLARIFSIPDIPSLRPEQALALACGVPPMGNSSTSSRQQLAVIAKVAEEMADGFKTGVERISGGAREEVKQALSEFLVHVQSRCNIPTAFERATEAFYLPSSGIELEPPPDWWVQLTVDCWTELLSEASGDDDATGELLITCTNAIVPVVRSMPAIVRDMVELSISATDHASDKPATATLVGGSYGKEGIQIEMVGAALSVKDVPPLSGQRSPIVYKVQSESHKPASAKVISLQSWVPGIVVTSRMATKLVPPKKPPKAKGAADWVSSLALPGSGRYELLLLVTPDTDLVEASFIPDDATETLEGERKLLAMRQLRDSEYQVEIEAEGKYQLNIEYRHPVRKVLETCTIFIACEDTREEGCRSEFERLIKRNRQHLEKVDTKSVVQLDRNARLSSLQAWLLDEHNVAKSFGPIVLADDYGSVWSPPDWHAPTGPVMSKARFLHDPRPEPARFSPPSGFVEARQQIAARIRASTGEDQLGLVESSPLGKWLAKDDGFRQLIEAYLDSYATWLEADRDVASWVDTIAVCQRETGGRTLARVPDAIILSPLHPIRLAWHCLAQQVLHDAVEGDENLPCPAASILDPDCVPDILSLPLQSPGGRHGLDHQDFISVECDSDYWSVLWNGSRLGALPARSQEAPFDNVFGLKVGGISSGFSPAQVGRALEDVVDLLAAKPTISLVISSDGGSTDACNEGLVAWCTRRFGSEERAAPRQGAGPRMLEVYDTRAARLRPDQATIANLSEDTQNQVRWFEKQPANTRPDLGIIAQLDSTQPESTEVGTRSPLSFGGLVRHRVRRQLNGSFLSESRQSRPMPPSGHTFPDKLVSCILAFENGSDDRIGLQFAPNVHAVSSMLDENNAGFVAVSSSAIDPACFLGGWIPGTYLWDYDLPSYSQRAGDTSGYYLLSQVREADRDALMRVLKPLLKNSLLDTAALDAVLLEVARRGIPTVRGLSGDDTGASGDLGLFLASRLLQDQFRPSGNLNSLLPVLSGTEDDACIALVIPVDPFRGYLADLARSLGNGKKDLSLSRPDLLVVGIRAEGTGVRIQLTPVEVKFRQGSVLSSIDSKDALGQAKALSKLFHSMQGRATKSVAWQLAFQHLLLSMIGFGLRVYSQHQLVANQQKTWARYHELIASAILESAPSIGIDDSGRLIVVDGSPESAARDHDSDGLPETIVVAASDARRMLTGDAQEFYDQVRAKVGNWALLPMSKAEAGASVSGSGPKPSASNHNDSSAGTGSLELTPDGDDAGTVVGTIDELEDSSSMPGDAPQHRARECAGVDLSVGTTVDGFEPRRLSLNISDTRLNQLNIGVVGDLGTGKTQLLKSLIFQVARAQEQNRDIKPRFLIFDYKRDYSSPEFVTATNAKVVKPKHLPFNLFDTTPMAESSTPWLDRFRFFADVLDKVYSGIGPVQRDKLKGAVRNAYESCKVRGTAPTIYDIHAEYREMLGGKSDTPMSIIDDLVDMEIFERDPAKTKSFDDFMDGVVVVSLDAMGQDDRSKNMLVAIMLNMFYENMLRTPKRPFEGTDPQLRVIDSYLLVDEADNIMRYEFDVLRKLLLQGREFGVGVILASQYLRHFKAGATDYREPLLTWFIHKVPNVAPAELGSLGLTSDLGDLAERVKTLPNHHCLYKSFDVAGEVIRGAPFYEVVKDT
jgi:DNA phosphorothioation-dependent restriction protein DptH